MFRVPEGTEMTPELLAKYMGKHKREIALRYKRLHDAYENKYKIDRLPKKEAYKPDNRIPVNFAKYITDTFNGFFIGIPIKTQSDDEAVNTYIEFLDQYNDQDDNNAELSKLCSIYGKGYELYYNDAESNIAITYLSPMDAFMIYDESIIERPLFFVRHYRDSNNVERGSWSDGQIVQHFVNRGSYVWDGKPEQHFFDGVPATEYSENKEQIGIFESVLPMIDAYNKAISEKSNDVDYFADAYLKIIGPKVEPGDTAHMRSTRVMNFEGENDELSNVVAEFMEKPNADGSQENLLDRLENQHGGEHIRREFWYKFRDSAQVQNAEYEQPGQNEGKKVPIRNEPEIQTDLFESGSRNAGGCMGGNQEPLYAELPGEPFG